MVKLVRLPGTEQHQLARLRYDPLVRADDAKRPVEDPDQLPFRVKMRGAVIHRVKKEREPFELLMADDFVLFRFHTCIIK